jgi:hypothetical protein
MPLIETLIQNRLVWLSRRALHIGRVARGQLAGVPQIAVSELGLAPKLPG